jgi:hypothetical protein
MQAKKDPCALRCWSYKGHAISAKESHACSDRIPEHV